MSNYATKFDLKIAAAVDTSKFAKKTDLARFKSDFDRLDIGKLETTPIGSNDQKDVEKNEAIKKTVYDELVKKVNAVRTADTSNLVKKTHFNTKFKEVVAKIPAHDKYITTQEFDKLIADNFGARLEEANLATKNDIADFVKETDFDKNLKNINKKA